MGVNCSYEDIKKKLKACEEKVKSLEQLNNMKSSQTNLGILSIGVLQSSNDNCECISVWGTLEIIAAIALFFLVTYLLFRCISSYCKKRKAKQEQKQHSIEELLDRSWKERETNRDTTIEMTGAQAAARPCPREHLHLHDDLSLMATITPSMTWKLCRSNWTNLSV